MDKPPATPPLPPHATEGQLIAYGKLVAALPDLLDEQSLRAVLDWLEDRKVFSDGQEDPDAVMDDGLATELRIAETFRQIADRLEGRAP